MIAVDTNVLVRILANDPDQPAQVAAARRLANKAKRVFIPLVVQVGAVWVLESGYGLTKDSIAQALEHIEISQAFVLQDEDSSHRALELYRSSNADCADCVILIHCRTKGLTLHTFDKQLGKLEGAALLKADGLK